MTDDNILSSTDDAATAIANQRDEGESETTFADTPLTEELSAEGADAEPDQNDAFDPASGDMERQGEPEEAPVNAAPASWPRDRIDEWNDLTPAAQEVFLEREGQVHSAISDKGREAAEARRQAQEATNRVTGEYQDRITKLNELLPTLVHNFKSKYEQIDWVRLADEDPASYTRLRAQAEAERGQIETATVETQHATAQAEEAFHSQQFEQLLSRNPHYGSEAGRQLLAQEAREVEAYAMSIEGVSPDQLKMISAPVYETLRDAMRFRKASRAATGPAKLPGQRSARPGARRSSSEVSKKIQSDAKAKLKALAKSGAGRNAQDRALADAIAAKRRTK